MEATRSHVTNTQFLNQRVRSPVTPMEAFCVSLQQVFAVLFAASLVVGILYFPLLKGMPIGYLPVAAGVLLVLITSRPAVKRFIESHLRAMTTHRYLALIVLAAIAIRLAVVLTIGLGPVSDHAVYHKHAVRMLDGHGYGPTAFFAPGMSFWLLGVYTILGKSVLCAQLVNAFIGAACAVLTYQLGRRIVSESAARVAGVMAVLFPSLVLYSTTLGNDVLVACGLVGVMLMLMCGDARHHTWWHLSGMGVLIGVLAFIKPVGLLVPAVLTLAYWRRGVTVGRALRNGLIITVCMVVTLLPWSLRNHRIFGEYVAVTTSGGVNLWMTNHDGATALHEPLPATLPPLSETERDKILWRQSWTYILDHPGRFARMLIPKSAYLWGTSSTVMASVSADRWNPTAEAAAKGLINTCWTFVCLWFVVALYRDGLFRSATAFWPVFAMLAYVWGIHLFYEAQSRYHLAVLPILFVGAASAWMGGSRTYASGSRSTQDPAAPLSPNAQNA